MDSKSKNREKIEHALKEIAISGGEIISECETNLKMGWTDLVIGDAVYFKAYDDDNDVITIAKGEIVGITTEEVKVQNKPDDNMKSDGYHNEIYITYRILWGNRKIDINSKFVYTDKLKAVLASIHDTVNSYFK